MTVKEMLESNMLICKLTVVYLMGSVRLHEYIFGADDWDERRLGASSDYTLSTELINHWEIDEHPTGWGVDLKKIPKEILSAEVKSWRCYRYFYRRSGEKYELRCEVEM